MHYPSRLCIGILALSVLAGQLATASEPQWWTDKKRECELPSNLDYNTWVKNGSPCKKDADRVRASAAEAQRQREAELERQRVEAEIEQQRIEAEIKRRAEQIAAQARFDQEKREALDQLKGVSNGDNSDSASGLKGAGVIDSGLKGVGSTESDLKDAPNSGDSTRQNTLPDVNTNTQSLNQARVAAGQGKFANQSSNNRSASDAARHPFDDADGIVAPMPVVPGSPISAPALVPDRIKHLPEFKTMAAAKKQLQNRMKELDSRLKKIHVEQAKNQTPNQALIMEEVKTKHEMNAIPGQIVVKQMEIDKFVLSMEEEPTPNKGEAKASQKTPGPPSPSVRK